MLADLQTIARRDLVAIRIPVQKAMRNLVRQRCGLCGDASLSRADLNLLPARSTGSTVEAALLDKTHDDAARLGKAQQSSEHICATLASGFRRQLGQWRAISLADIEHVHDLEPDTLGLVTDSVFVLEEHRR